VRAAPWGLGCCCAPPTSTWHSAVARVNQRKAGGLYFLQKALRQAGRQAESSTAKLTVLERVVFGDLGAAAAEGLHGQQRW
jgi:hypothetical protein